MGQVSHTDGSDKYDRRVFGSCPFCALLARPKNPGSMSESCGHNQGVASAPSDVAGMPRARGCDKSKVPEGRAPKVRVPDHLPRESHTCMESADTELINHNAWLHGFDRSQVAHLEVLVFGRGGRRRWSRWCTGVLKHVYLNTFL